MQKLCRNAAQERETILRILRPLCLMGGNIKLCGKFEIFPYLGLEDSRWKLSVGGFFDYYF